MNLLIRPEAESDIGEAFDYYEATGEGLEPRFCERSRPLLRISRAFLSSIAQHGL